MRVRTICGLWLFISAVLAQAAPVELAPDHPQRYIVVKGDTLWDIASKFLTNPWQWRQIWRDNPQIANPHWIYPGDELELSMVDGAPRLQVARHGYAYDRPDEEKLEPEVRVLPLDQAIPTIPLSLIQQYLVQPKVANAGEMESSPYVVALADEHVVGGAGDRVYVRGMPENALPGYMIFRAGKPYADADTGEILGYEALYVADAELEPTRDGDASVMKIDKSDREVLIGDRILPVEAEKMHMRFEPHPPDRPVNGHIIAVVDGVSQIGQFQVVIIDRGLADGVETGHVLEISQSGRIQRDILSPLPGEEITLPSEKEGVLMIFRPYERVSFGLVMKATRAIHLFDAVRNP